jgi:beta-lactam-binding protein with PASTA domain
VLAQSPQNGELLPRGSVVTLTVATSPPPPTPTPTPTPTQTPEPPPTDPVVPSGEPVPSEFAPAG